MGNKSTLPSWFHWCCMWVPYVKINLHIPPVLQSLSVYDVKLSQYYGVLRTFRPLPLARPRASTEWPTGFCILAMVCDLVCKRLTVENIYASVLLCLQNFWLQYSVRNFQSGEKWWEVVSHREASTLGACIARHCYSSYEWFTFTSYWWSCNIICWWYHTDLKWCYFVKWDCPAELGKI